MERSVIIIGCFRRAEVWSSKYEARHHFDLKRVREEQSANFSVIGRNKVSF